MIKLKRESIIQLMTRKKIIRNFNKIIINFKDNLNLNPFILYIKTAFLI